MQTMTAPRARLIPATTEVNILGEFGEPIQLIQNTGASDALVIFNGGTVPFTIRASETIVFDMPIYGTIESDADLTALA
mgnify:CR=1 FL=1